MADSDDFESRARHLRKATEELLPPTGLAERIVQNAVAQPPVGDWLSTVMRFGRRGLVFAALVAAASVFLARLSESRLEDAIASTTLLEGP
jgi:hypothetical protein